MPRKHNMNPDKSGVIIFFEPMLEEADALDDARLAQLFRAILHFAVGDGDPTFEDETLRHIWRFVRVSVIRDDKNYTKKVAGKQYGVYCRYAKQNHYTPLAREEWDALGGPTFKEWEKLLKSETYTNAYNAYICNPTSDSSSTANSFSSPPSGSESASEPTSGADASEPPVGGGPTDPDPDDAERKESSVENADERTKPYEKPTLEQVKRYCRQNDLRDVDPVRYYDYCCANGWTMRGGRRIYDWRAHVRTWNEGDRKRNGTASDGDGDNYGYSDEVAKYVRERMEKRKKREAAQGSGEAESGGGTES